MKRIHTSERNVKSLHFCREADCAACRNIPPLPPSPDPIGPAVPAGAPMDSFGALWARFRVSPDLVQAAASILRPDRRRAHRHEMAGPWLARPSTFVLGEWERSLLRRQALAAGRCETGLMTASRVTTVGGSPMAQRLSFRPRCCSRSCGECDATRRSRQASRTEGPWRLFATFGVPAQSCSARDAWFQINGWISSLMSRIRDYGRRGSGGAVRICYPFRATWSRDRELLYPDRRPPGLIRYAWVVEPHESGYPHVHAIFTVDYIDSLWLRETWGSIVGAPVLWCKLKPVTNPDGICRYLSKYITKTRLPPEILAVLGPGRMFACTLPRYYPRGGGWHLDKSPEGRLFTMKALDPDQPDLPGGWRRSEGSSGSYCLSVKPLAWGTLAERLPSTTFSYDRPPDVCIGSDEFDPIYISTMFELIGADPNTGALAGLPPSSVRDRYWRTAASLSPHALARRLVARRVFPTPVIPLPTTCPDFWVEAPAFLSARDMPF